MIQMYKTLLLIPLVCTMMMLSGCSTTRRLSITSEVSDTAGIGSEIPEATADNTPSVYVEPEQPRTPPVILSGDRQEEVTVVDPSQQALLRDYNIVVGSFGNRNNADNMLTRMTGRGFSAFLVQNVAGLYRVVAASTNIRADAVSVRDDIRATYSDDDPGTCPAAWLLIPAR